MKKILFVAIAVAALSNVASAQEAAASAKRAPAQDQKTVDKAAKNKVERSAAATTAENSDQARSATLAPTSKYSLYTKAGLTPEQAVQMSSNMQDIDKRKADIENNTQLTPLQKSDAMQAIEAERTAILKKGMGPTGYKKYVELKAADGKMKSAN